MEISGKLLCQIESDLGLNVPFVKGQNISVKNCWHFYTDGRDVDIMFSDETCLRDGMNRIYVQSLRFDVIILAFVLMDTHVHFVLYGSYSECSAFTHEYIRSTSRYISIRYKEKNRLGSVKINHQEVDTDLYLKIVIPYVIKNPTSGGMPWMPYNYPWSSGALYFARNGNLAPNSWSGKLDGCRKLKELSIRETRTLFHTRDRIMTDANLLDGLAFPGDYVAYEIVERIFRTTKSFQYFMSLNKEDEIEGRGGSISNLSLPIQELRQHKNEICMDIFGRKTVRDLDTTQRIKLAKILKSRFNSSTKQIARLCGLKYDEIIGIL